MKITKEKKVEIFSLMLKIRAFEEKAIQLYEHGRLPGFIHVCLGQEAVPVGVCAALRKDDYITSTHRGHGHIIAKGARVDRMMAELFAKDTGYCRGRGGSMHISDFGSGILGAMGIVGSGLPIANGAALSSQLKKSGQVAVSFFGDGASNQGAFHEALNLASIWELPVVFVCENNQYAVSTPQAEHQKIRHISERAAAYNITGRYVDGNSVLKVYKAAEELVERARAGRGPALLECKTYRMAGHYVGDKADYRTQKEVDFWKGNDPIGLFEEGLLKDRILNRESISQIKQEVKKEILDAVEFARSSPEPKAETALDYVFVDDKEGANSVDVTTNEVSMPDKSNVKEITYRQAVREALAEEMARDKTVFLIGEDVGRPFGGADKITLGLWDKFGDARVRNTPISEAAIIGAAIGAALTGMRPVAEIMYFDFIAVAMDQVVNQMAKIRFMSGGQTRVPAVIRTVVGAGRSSAAQHSQSLESWFLHIPGLFVVMPSNAYDAKGLLKTAIRTDNPVIFIEPKLLYSTVSSVPVTEYTVPLGKAEIKRPGEDLTVVAIGNMVSKALAAADRLSEKGIKLEVIDPRTIVPLDRETIIDSVKKTGRLIITHEANERGGFGAEIAAMVAKEAFNYLDSPIERVAARNAPSPFSPVLEAEVLPGVNRIIETAEKML